MKEANEINNFDSKPISFYNAMLYRLAGLPIAIVLLASVLLSGVFPASGRVCLNMHCLCFADKWKKCVWSLLT